PVPAVQQLQRHFTIKKTPEFVEMLTAIARGSRMGLGDGWFHPSQSRHDWNWLARRHGLEPKGSITRQDFRGPKDLFDRLDRNRDGVLNAEDFDWSPGSTFLRESGQAQMLFYMLDRDSNGRITQAEWEAAFKRLAG